MQIDKGFFFELTPDRVLEAVEASGLRCTGRCIALNSFENRVYDVELDLEGVESLPHLFEKNSLKHFSENRRIVKFYRPGRWTYSQIMEEHAFLADLVQEEISAVAPLAFPSGQTLHSTRGSGIWYALFPKVGGRAPDELSDDQLIRVGRLLGRMHNVGASKKSRDRVRIDPQTYGRDPLEFLIKGNWIPVDFQNRYQSVVEKIVELTESAFESLKFQRIHGDCHLGNLLWNESGPFFLDFDDMVLGPAVQDIWLLVPGRDPESLRQRQVLLEGYQEFRHFDLSSLRFIELLRALRFIHYTAWIARRWDDPAFPLAFPQFGLHPYWSREVDDLEQQLDILQRLSVTAY